MEKRAWLCRAQKCQGPSGPGLTVASLVGCCLSLESTLVALAAGCPVLACDFLLCSSAAPGSTKSGHHLSFPALAVMHTAPAQLPIQVTIPLPLPPQQPRRWPLSTFVLESCSLDPGCVPDTGPVALGRKRTLCSMRHARLCHEIISSGDMIISILQVRELSLRKGEHLNQGHSAGKCRAKAET